MMKKLREQIETSDKGQRRYEKCKRSHGVIGNRKGIMRKKNR